MTYNLGQNGWEIYPPSPLPTKSRIGNGALWLLCGFILDLGGGLGFAVPFYYVQDCNLLKKNILSKIESFESKTNYQHRSTRTNSAVWQVPYACAQPNHPGSGSNGQLFLPYRGYPVGSHACSSSCFFFLQIHFRPKFCNFRSLSNESPTIFSYFLKFKFHISLPKLGYFS